MKKFNMTAQEAMETLDISKADFKMYMSLLQVILFRGKKLVEESAGFFSQVNLYVHCNGQIYACSLCVKCYNITINNIKTDKGVAK